MCKPLGRPSAALTCASGQGRGMPGSEAYDVHSGGAAAIARLVSVRKSTLVRRHNAHQRFSREVACPIDPDERLVDERRMFILEERGEGR
ncbi:hypothetical protein WK09_05140 [Burkholderia ubonensis]|nr:hypothetical protein WK09_05140 [Burkholderia ubonensis]